MLDPRTGSDWEGILFQGYNLSKLPAQAEGGPEQWKEPLGSGDSSLGSQNTAGEAGTLL